MATRSNSNTSPSEVTPEAKRWTECLERFKLSIDSMYEICRTSRNVAGCKEALLYLKNATHDFESLIGMINVEETWENDPNNKSQAVAWEVKATSNAIKNFQITEGDETEESWHVVQNRKRRNTNSSEEDSEDGKSGKEIKKTSVYERLAYNLPRPVRPTSPNDIVLSDSSIGTNLMCPRSAMDLPQTRASMAKMAYSRERLWKGRVKPLLEERLQRRQQASNGLNRKPTYSQVAKTAPADKSESDKKSREPSLASISETAEEDDDNLSTVTMAELSRPATSSSVKRSKSDEKNGKAEEKEFTLDDIKNSEISTDSLMKELEGDDEWRSITAEEESLAQEEESLQKEILEEERSSIDDEFEREANKRFGKTPPRYKKSWKEVVENWSPVPDVKNPNEASTSTKTSSPDVIYRKPGEVAHVHEKLSSPSRKKPSTDFEKRLLEKQQKAYELRQKLLEEKAQRLKELHQKVNEVKVRRESVVAKKMNLITEKMLKACENRQKNLAEVVKRAKTDDHRIKEIQLINTLEAMNLKNEIDTKDQIHKEKLQNLAEQQERRKQILAAKHAQAEGNRITQQQKQQERLQEKTEKLEARIQNAVAQRNELLEETRQKQRKVTKKIEKLKEEENKNHQVLKEKLQTKLVKAEKMHEEGLELVKLKAAEQIAARVLSASQTFILWMNETEEDVVPKKCQICKMRIMGDVHMIAHICSTSHLVNRKLIDKPLTIDLFRQESENAIVPLKDSDELKDTVVETGIPVIDITGMKKRRSKLKQKLVKESVTVYHVPDIMSHAMFKLLKDIENGIANVIKAGSLSDSIRNSLEKNVTELDKTLYGEGGEPNEQQILKTWNFGLVPHLLHLLQIPSFYEKSIQVPTKRLFLKCCAILHTVFGHEEVTVSIFQSPYFSDTVELLVMSMRTFLQSHYEYERTAAVLSLLEAVTRYFEDLTGKCKERLNITAIYLISHGFIEVVTILLRELCQSGIPDKLQLSTNLVICNSVSIAGPVIAFLRFLPDNIEKTEELFALLMTYVYYVVNKLQDTHVLDFNHPDETTESKNEESLINNFFNGLVRTISLIAPCPPALPLLRRALLVNDGILGMRLVLLLIGVLKKEIRYLTRGPKALNADAVKVAGYLPFIDPILGRMCIVGWQSSLLYMSAAQWDPYCNSSTRTVFMTSIVSMVRTNHVALETLQFHLGVSWPLMFLQIWGKLQKLRRVFKKNLRDSETGPDFSEQNKKHTGTKTQGSRYQEPVKSECSEDSEDPKFNFSGLRRRLEEPPIVERVSGKTGNSGLESGEMFENGKPPLGTDFEPERPPRPSPPRPEIVDDEEDSDEVASVSSEERAPVVVPLPPRTIQMPLMDTSHLSRITHPTAFREKIAEVFIADEIGSVPLPKLLEVRRYIQMINNVENFFDAIPMSHLTHISINIVETILHLVDDLDEVNEAILKHVRHYLNFLFTCGNKSLRFRSTFEKHSALHWLGMLRFHPIKNDIIISLNFFTDTLVILYSDDNFMHWLNDVVACIQGNSKDNSEQRKSIIAYIMKLLELYPFFLYRCHENMSRNLFDEVLLAMEAGIQNLPDDWQTNWGQYRGPPVSLSAVRFLIKFVDMVIDDFKDESIEWQNLVTRMILLMDTISCVIKNIPCHRKVFSETPAIMHYVCILQNILVMGDEILKIPALQNHQQTVRRQGITYNRGTPGRRAPPLAALVSDERMDTEDNSVNGREGLARSKTMPTDGPPDRKYPRRSLEQESIENHPATSATVYPLPSVDIMEFDSTTGFRSRENLLNLYRYRKISSVYVMNLKKSTLRIIGSLCVAVPEFRDIAAEYGIVDAAFKTTKAGESIKSDYLVVARGALVEICMNHEQNFQSLKDIEPSPAHLLAKHEVIDRLMLANGNSHH